MFELPRDEHKNAKLMLNSKSQVAKGQMKIKLKEGKFALMILSLSHISRYLSQRTCEFRVRGFMSIARPHLAYPFAYSRVGLKPGNSFAATRSF